MARGAFYAVRVSVLLASLAVVVLYAWRDHQQRQVRNEWKVPVQVGVVLLDHSAGRIAPEVCSELAARVGVLGGQLSSQLLRYRSARQLMFELTPYGPVSIKTPPPVPASDTWLALLAHSFHLWRYARQVDAAAGVPSRGLDSRIYLVLEPVNNEKRKLVEGFSQQGGHVGVARVQLDESTIDLGLFVVAHELMHTLGARDKYDAFGRTLLPEGLGDPEQRPLYPQNVAEVMARNRVLSPGYEVTPDTLEQLSVGRETAREIGWID